MWGRAYHFLHNHALNLIFIRSTSRDPVVYAKHALCHRNSELPWNDNDDITLFWYAMPVYCTYLRLLYRLHYCISPPAQNSGFPLESISRYVYDFASATLLNDWLYSYIRQANDIMSSVIEQTHGIMTWISSYLAQFSSPWWHSSFQPYLLIMRCSPRCVADLTNLYTHSSIS